jgi:hypothetical protein
MEKSFYYCPKCDSDIPIENKTIHSQYCKDTKHLRFLGSFQPKPANPNPVQIPTQPVIKGEVLPPWEIENPKEERHILKKPEVPKLGIL